MEVDFSNSVFAVCEHCGCEFTKNKPWQKYCNRKCKGNAGYRRNPRPGGRAKTDEQLERRRQTSSKWYYENRETVLENYKAKRLAAQVHGDCGVCGTRCRLVRDHDHETGEWRDYICNSCNLALGHAKDDPNILVLLAFYLERHGKKIHN